MEETGRKPREISVDLGLAPQMVEKWYKTYQKDKKDAFPGVGKPNAFDKAVYLRKPTKGLMFHSDRGIQYLCSQFQDKLIQYGRVGSMSRRGNCYDNAIAESFFHTLKTELVNWTTYQTREETRRSFI